MKTKLQRVAFRPWMGWGTVFAIHLLFFWWFFTDEYFAKYPLFAELLRAGKLTGEVASAPSPLYLLVSYILSPIGLRILHSIAAALVLRTVYRTGFALGGYPLAFASTILLAGSRPFLIYEGVLEPDFLLMALLFSGVGLVWERGTRASMLLGGACLGLSIPLRPIVLPTVAIIGLWVGLRAWRERRPGAGGFGTLVASGLVLASCAASPSLIVHLATGSPLGISMSGGSVLYEGNRPEGTGDGAAPPYVLKIYEQQVAPSQAAPDHAHALYRRFARLTLGEQATLQEIQAYWAGFVKRFWEVHPGAFLKLQLRKLAFTLTGSTAIDLKQVRKLHFEQDGNVFPWPSLWLFPLGLVGLVPFVWSRRDGALFAVAWGTLALSIASFYPSDRYLLVLVPFVSLFAGVIPCVLLRGVRIGRREFLCMAVGLGLALALVSLNAVSENRRVTQRLIAATGKWPEVREHLVSGRLSRAAETLRSAQADFPFGEWGADFRFLPLESPVLAAEAARQSEKEWGKKYETDRIFTAFLHARAGDCDKAAEWVGDDRSTGFMPHYQDLLFDPDLMVARCLLSTSDLPGAERRIERSLRAAPGNAEALALGSAVAKVSGSVDRAAELKDGLFALHDPVSAHYALARSLRAAGNHEEASASIERALDLLPDCALFEFEKTLILAAQGRWPESARLFNRSVERFPAWDYPVSDLDRGFERLAGERPEDSEVAVARMRVLARMGRLAEALELANRWAPENERSRRMQQLLQRALSGGSPTLSDPARN